MYTVVKNGPLLSSPSAFSHSVNVFRQLCHLQIFFTHKLIASPKPTLPLTISIPILFMLFSLLFLFSHNAFNIQTHNPRII